MKIKHPFIYTLTLSLLTAALTCVIIAGTIGRRLGLLNGRYDEMREYAALLDEISELYIGEYSEAELSAAANAAAVAALGDRWSFYMTADEYASYLDSTGNRFTGIGVMARIDEETGGMSVESVYKGSPAETGGIVAGDVIIAVDGKDIRGKEFKEMTALLSRPINDSVRLDVQRRDGTVDSLTVTYGVVFIDPVSYEMLEGNIAYVMLANFETGSANGFINAVDKLTADGATSLIFDVRCNGGGRVSEMTRILDYLLPEGEIFIGVDRSGTEEITLSNANMIDLPCVVLVDRYSFSAAEYFAATLMEYNYALIVGEQTTGKDRSQITVTLPSGGALHISSGKFLTKNRVSLYETGGLTPDYQIALTDDELTQLLSGELTLAKDPQLQKAVELLRE